MNSSLLRIVDLLFFRLLKRDNPPLNLQTYLKEHQVPGQVIAGSRDLMRRMVGVGTGIPTVMVVNAELQSVYLNRGYTPKVFSERLVEAITCNTEFCDPESQYAREKHRFDGTVPDETLVAADGQEHRLSELIPPHGVAVIDFWASWCPPCLAAFEELAELHHQFESKAVIFLSINIGS